MKYTWLILLVFLTSCVTYKKQKQRAEQFYKENPTELAVKCQEEYPIKDSIIKGDTVYLKAENEDYTNKLDSLSKELEKARDEAVTVVIDSTNCPPEYEKLLDKYKVATKQIVDLKNSYKPCLPDTVWIKGDTVIKVDTREVAILTADLEKSEGQKKTWRTLFIIFVILFLLSAGYNYILLKRK